MNMPFCYKYTHPTIKLILRELETQPRTATELAKILRVSVSHARTACDWLRKQRLIHICAWLKVREHERKSGASLVRVWGRGRHPDAVRADDKRTQRRKARSTAALTLIDMGTSLNSPETV